jgi:transposase-like protein
MGKMRKWRRHTLEFKQRVVAQMKTCENIEALARELDIQRKLLYTWRDQLEGRPAPRHANYELTAEERKEKQRDEKVDKLESALAEMVLENSFLKSALFRVKEDRRKREETGASASTPSSGRGPKNKAV